MFAITSISNTALAGDQHVRFRRRHRIDQFFDLLHRLALEHWREARLRELQSLLKFFGFLSQGLRFAKERLFFERFLDEAEQLFRRIPFADEMEGAALD